MTTDDTKAHSQEVNSKPKAAPAKVKAAPKGAAKPTADRAAKKATTDKSALEKFSGKMFKVTMVRGFSGVAQTQRLTMAALGLRKINRSVQVADNAANRGQIMKVQHLVTVEVTK